MMERNACEEVQCPEPLHLFVTLGCEMPGSPNVRPRPTQSTPTVDDEKSVQANARPNPLVIICVRTQVRCKMSLKFMLVNDAMALSALQFEPYVLP